MPVSSIRCRTSDSVWPLDWSLLLISDWDCAKAEDHKRDSGRIATRMRMLRGTLLDSCFVLRSVPGPTTAHPMFGASWHESPEGATAGMNTTARRRGQPIRHEFGHSWFLPPRGPRAGAPTPAPALCYLPPRAGLDSLPQAVHYAGRDRCGHRGAPLRLAHHGAQGPGAGGRCN